MDQRVLLSLGSLLIVSVAGLLAMLISVFSTFHGKVTIHMIVTLPTLETGGQFIFNTESPLFYNESSPTPYRNADSVVVQRFAWNAEQALSASASSLPAGSAKGLDVYRLADIHSPLLFHALASGTLIEQLVLAVGPTWRTSSGKLGDCRFDFDDCLTRYTFTGVTIKTIHHSARYHDHNVEEHLHFQYGAVLVESSPKKYMGENKMDNGTLVAVRYWNGTGAPPDPKRTEIFEHNGAKVKVGINRVTKTPSAGSAYLPNKSNNWRSLVRIWLDGH